MGLLTTLTRHNVLLLLSLCTRGLSFESSFVHLSGVRHHIRDTGNVPGGDDSSPVAVLFHGFAGSCASWEEVAPMLAESGVRAIAIDRVGFGRSERPPVPTLPVPPTPR